MSDLGKIVITLNGDYNALTTYEKLCLVRYNGASYISTQTTTGNTPTSTSEYWQIVSVDGSDVDMGVFADTYSASQTYSKDDIVTYGNGLYKAKQEISVAEAWNASHWDQKTVAELLDEVTVTMDAVPTQNSTNAVQSGGVYTAVNGLIQTTTTDPGEGAAMTSQLLIVYEE